MTSVRPDRLLAALLFAALWSACSGSALLDRFVQIPDRSWQYDFRPEFEFHVNDTALAHRIYVNFRHSDEYRYANVFVLVHQESPDGAVETKRIELKLAEPDGRWTGRHSGNIYTHRHPIPGVHFFPDTGVFKLSIEQNMRENPLEQVVAAGLRIEAADPR